jgi:hypothetical protein
MKLLDKCEAASYSASVWPSRTSKKRSIVQLQTAQEEGILMALEKELATFKAKLPDLKEHQGKFVLIHGDEVVDFFVAYEDAIKAGYGKFRLEPFLVKQVSVTETIHHFTRHILPFNSARAA